MYEQQNGGGGELAPSRPRRSPQASAQLKGALAASEGTPLEKCPYQDKRQANGSATWLTSMRAAWQRGWLSIVQTRFE